MGEALPEVPAEVRAWIGQWKYPEETTFAIERGYVLSTCASVENGNPLYWDEAVAQELCGGPVAPPTMLSVWFRRHHWTPDGTGEQMPYQVHFDLKAALELPEAIITENEIVFGEPVRPGDRLRAHHRLASLSEPKTTRLGTGRFWVIEAEYHDQRDLQVAWESLTGYGYRRDLGGTGR